MTETSAPVATVVSWVAELSAGSGSGVVELTEAVFPMIVPAAVAAFTFTTRVKASDTPFGTLGFVHVIEPVPPTAGVTQAQPAAGVSETNVVFAGVVSESVA